jgi:hypothetical protein
VVLGLRAQPGKTLVFPQLRQFSVHKLSLNFCKIMNFQLTPFILQNDELSVDTTVKIFSKTLHVSAPSLPRHNSSSDLPNELPAELLSAPLVWVRRGGLVPPLQPLYYGSYAVLRCGPCSFTIRVGSRDKVVAVSGLKACTAANTTPGSLRRRSRPPFAPRHSCHNQGGLVFRPAGFFTFLFSGTATRWSWNRFPTRQGGFCTPRTGGTFTASTDAVPVSSTGTAKEVGALTSSPPSRGQRPGEPC